MRLSVLLVCSLVALGCLLMRDAAGDSSRSQEPVHRACRVFELNIQDGLGGYFSTADRTGPVGDWLGPFVDDGWRVEEVDFEIGRRATGFPESHVMVCVAR